MTDRQLAAALAGSAASSAAASVERAGSPVRTGLGSAEAHRWRWVLHPDSIDLYADSTAPDPDDQLILLSSGGALHHARIALAADGRAARVRLLPDDDPTHLATVTAAERIEVTDEARERYEAIGGPEPDGAAHHPEETEHHPGGPTPAEVDEFTGAAAAEGVRLVVLDPAQVRRLATASGLRATSRTKHGRTDVFGVLCGDSDAPENWLRAGAALSAISLLATRRGLTVVPSSAAVQLPRSRAVLRRLLPDTATPYLAVRIGARIQGEGERP